MKWMKWKVYSRKSNKIQKDLTFEFNKRIHLHIFSNSISFCNRFSLYPSYWRVFSSEKQVTLRMIKFVYMQVAQFRIVSIFHMLITLIINHNIFSEGKQCTLFISRWLKMVKFNQLNVISWAVSFENVLCYIGISLNLYFFDSNSPFHFTFPPLSHQHWFVRVQVMLS